MWGSLQTRSDPTMPSLQGGTLGAGPRGGNRSRCAGHRKRLALATKLDGPLLHSHRGTPRSGQLARTGESGAVKSTALFGSIRTTERLGRVLEGLIDGWCAHRSVAPLRALLPVWPLHTPLTDG